MRMLFATTAGAGHFGPLVPFADACLRAGHDVLVAGHAGAAPLVARAGHAFRPLAEPSHEEVARFRAGQHGLPPGQAMARALTDLYIRLYGGAALPDMVTAIEDWRPDVVVRESAEVSSMVAADRLGVPHAEVCVGLSSQAADRLLPLAAPRLDELRATVGLPRGAGAHAARLTLAPRSLDDPSPQPPASVRRFRERAGTGAGSLPDGWGDPDAPLVYVSFGTEVPSPSRDYFPGLYRRAIDALADLPVRVLVTIGTRREPAELGPLPPSVRVEQWVPQAGVMRAATATVTHGGAGSVLAALAAGVPMAVIPLFADQPLNAARVAERGAGIVLDGADGSLPTLGETVRTLIADARYGERAARIAGEIRALPPVDDAVDVLAAIAGRPAASVAD